MPQSSIAGLPRRSDLPLLIWFTCSPVLRQVNPIALFSEVFIGVVYGVAPSKIAEAYDDCLVSNLMTPVLGRIFDI